MPSLRSSLSLLALSAAVATRPGAAATCTADEVASTDSLMLWAASTVDCAASSVLTATSADVFWLCSDLYCAHVMRQVGDELPDCDYASDGGAASNKKQAIADQLASCGICTSAQEDEISALYKAAAGDPRCAAEASVIDDAVEINWSCGTTCQAVMEDLYAKVPDCMMTIGANEKADLAESTGSCTSGGGGILGGSTPSTGDATSSPSTEDATSTPLWEPTTTGSGSSWLTGGEGGDTVTAPTYSSESCSSAELTAMVTSVYDAANSWECSSEVTVSTSEYSFYASCYGMCSTTLELLAADLPDCYYDTQGKNLKEDLTAQTAECWALRQRRNLRSMKAASLWSYVDFTFVVPATTDFVSNSSSSSSSSNAAVGSVSVASAGALGLLAAVAHVLAVV